MSYKGQSDRIAGYWGRLHFIVFSVRGIMTYRLKSAWQGGNDTKSTTHMFAAFTKSDVIHTSPLAEKWNLHSVDYIHISYRVYPTCEVGPTSPIHHLNNLVEDNERCLIVNSKF